MENLFDFEYHESRLYNNDGTKSKFNAIFGDSGKIIHCKKDSYSIVRTEDLSTVGNVFIEIGKKKVSTFSHNNGEIIGLNIDLGESMTKVGEKTYNAIITVPNNGSGCGFLTLKELRLICTNGAVHTEGSFKDRSIKIPHRIDYNKALELTTDAIVAANDFIKIINSKEEYLTKEKISEHNVRFILNKWFYEKELPLSAKKEMSFDTFRFKLIDDVDSIDFIHRYKMLMKAFHKEVEYNSVLDLELSKYSVIAIINNYLSRRLELSKSLAPEEIKMARQSEKLVNIDQLIHSL